MRIGQFTQGGTQFMTGYISNARVVKGQALYTANFTPSTTSLTTTSQGITSANVLLVCNDNRFRDANTTPRTITVTGVPSANAYSPFAETVSNIGSAYFDGSGDNIIVADDPVLELGSGTFCVECWFYTNSISVNGVIIDKRSGTYGPLLVWRSAAFLVVYMSSNNTSWDMLNAVTVPFTIAINTWYHFALYRIGGTIYASINGFVYNLGGSAATPFNNAGNWYIGTGTNSADGFTGYISDFRMVIGSSVYTTANYVPQTTSLTTISNTQLLLFQNYQGENNHRFNDETTRKDLVIRTGDVSMGSFTPFSPVGWSANFNGLSDSISVPAGTDFAYGTGDFTVEGWVWPQSFSGSPLIWTQTTSGTNYFVIGFDTAGNIAFTGTSSGGGTGIFGPTVTTLATWNHFAVVRQSGNITVYINGVGGTSTTNTTNFTDTSYVPTIGRYTHSATQHYQGYISNFRVVKGVAVYTGNFTVPSTSLSTVQSAGTNIAAITSGTVFLAFQQNRFIDSNTTPKTMTYLAGTPRIQPFSPFRPSVSYDPALHGGSARFDGTGDYLTYPAGPTFNFRTFDFTIEAWVYLPANQTASASIVANNSNPNGWYFYFDASNYLKFANFATNVITSGYPVRVGEWTHVALRRAGTSMVMYVNGLQSASVTNSTTYGDAAAVTYVGTNTTAAIFNGFISGLRVVKGQSLFSGNFTVPTSPPGLTQSASTNVAAITTANTVSNVSMLMNFTQAAIYDVTGRNVIQTIAPAQVSNVTYKYGTGSLYFPTKTAAFQIYNHPHLTQMVADFTIECWVYPMDTALTSTWGVIDGRQAGGTAAAYQLGLNNYSASAPIGWQMFYYNGTVYQSTTTRIQGNVWTHCAWVRSGTTLTFYADGVPNGTATVSGAQIGATTAPIYIGTKDNGIAGYGSTGYIDDLRITNGIARYTSGFTVPTKFLNK